MNRPSNCGCATSGNLGEIDTWFGRQMKAIEYAIGNGPYNGNVGTESCTIISAEGFKLLFSATLTSGGNVDSDGRPLKGRRLTGEEIWDILSRINNTLHRL